MTEIFDTLVQPLFWLALTALFVVAGVFVLKYPGGPGAHLFFWSSVVIFGLSTLDVIDTFWGGLVSGGIIPYEGPIHYLYSSVWMIFGLVQAVGLVLLFLRLGAECRRRVELEQMLESRPEAMDVGPRAPDRVS